MKTTISNANLQEIMNSVTKMFMEESNYEHPRQINQGDCEAWVYEVMKQLPEDALALGWWLNLDDRLTEDDASFVSHCVLWYEGKWYDCLRPNGVDDPLKCGCFDVPIPGYEPQWKEDVQWFQEIMKRSGPPSLWNIAKEFGEKYKSDIEMRFL